MLLLFIILLFAVILPSFTRTTIAHVCLATIIPLLTILQLFFILNNGNDTTFTLNYAISISFTTTTIYLYFAIFIAFLWMFAGIYSVYYIQREYGAKKLNIFLPFYNISIATTIFIIFSANIITTFIFYEILTIVTLPLVAFNGDEKSIKALKKYAFTLFFTTIIFFLPAMFICQNVVGTTAFMQDGTVSSFLIQEISDADLYNYQYIPSHNMMIFAFILLMFGIAKNAIFPLNGWLPAAMVAPVPVSALLHAVAVVKSGAFITYKIIYEFFGIEYINYLKHLHGNIFTIITLIATIGIIIASVKAIRTTDIKKVLAFSTISNMTYIFLLFLTATEETRDAGFLHIIIHGITKIGLFFVAGVLYTMYHTNDYRRMAGAFNKHTILAFAMVVFSLSLMGMPLTAGFSSKKMMIISLYEAKSYIAIFGVMFSALATVMYLGKPLFYLCSRTKKLILDHNIYILTYATIVPMVIINIGIFIGFFIFF